MNDSALTDWLMDNGGPVVRRRTAAELLRLPRAELKRYDAELLDSPPVRLWLERLEHVGRVHNSGNDCLENVIGKLMEFGLRAGMTVLDERLCPFRRLLNSDAAVEHGALGRSIVAWGLAWAGYDDASLNAYLTARLDELYRLTNTGSYDIYVLPGAFSDVPKAFQGRPIVKPEIMSKDVSLLSSIHDLYALAHMPSNSLDEETCGKIGAVIRYVLHPDYQALPNGYGIARTDTRRYFAIGWNVDLPGYDGFDMTDWKAGYFVQRVELMSRFAETSRRRWFRESVRHLDTCRTERGTWLFPRRYLKKRQTGYWVTGAHMGLEENRRSKLAIEIESTFRMLKIRSARGAACPK